MRESNYLFLISFGIVTFLVSILFISNIGFFLGLNIHVFYLPVGLCITLIVLYLINPEKFLKPFTLFLILFIFSVVVSSFIFDFSWDGRAYHQPAIFELSEGWNPVLNPQIENRDVPNRIIIEHFPKATWILGASLNKITGHIETAKFANYLIVFLLFLFSIYFMEKISELKRTYQFIIALLIVLNPVIITQLNSFNVDGNLAALIMILLFSIVLFLKYDKNIYFIMAILTIVILANLKFTGLVYSMIIMILFYIFKALIKKSIDLKLLRNIFFSYLIIVFLFGFSPYITNTIFHSHPFFPLMGEGKIDIMKKKKVKSFLEKDRFSKFFYANYSEMNNKNEFPRLKSPFVFEAKDLKKYRQSSLKIGGFGVYFGLILIVSLILIFGLFLSGDIKKYNKYIIFIFVSVIISSIVNPEMWWARYAPQIWVIPIMILICSINSKQKILKGLSILSLIIILINSGFVFFYSLSFNISMTIQTSAKLQALNKSKYPIIIATKRRGFRYSLENKLNYYQIQYKLVDYEYIKANYKKYDHIIDRNTIYKVIK